MLSPLFSVQVIQPDFMCGRWVNASVFASSNHNVIVKSNSNMTVSIRKQVHIGVSSLFKSHKVNPGELRNKHLLVQCLLPAVLVAVVLLVHSLLVDNSGAGVTKEHATNVKSLAL